MSVWGIGIGAVVAVAGAASSADASRKASNTQADAAREASAASASAEEQNQQDQAPWRDAGVTALGQLTQGTAAGGDFNRDFTMGDFQKDPGYAFRQAEGQRGLEASAAARGGLLSGGAGKGLTRYNQDYATGEYSNAYNRFNADRDRRFNRLSGLANTGQVTSQQVGQAGMNAANQQGENMMGAGNARASGYVGQANAVNQGIGTLGNLAQSYSNRTNTQSNYQQDPFGPNNSWGSSQASATPTYQQQNPYGMYE